jgi:ABC-type multidrug transport system ATPase subunit
VCPQFNVLFEHLTVQEHLWFFASLKQTPPSKVHEEVHSFMKNVGLADKADSFARELSGKIFCGKFD